MPRVWVAVMPNRSRALLLAVLTILGTMAIAAAAADAWPPRTVFSARNGNGLCLVAGQGLTVAARCTVATGACPARTMRKGSNNDPTRTYYLLLPDRRDERTGKDLRVARYGAHLQGGLLPWRGGWRTLDGRLHKRPPIQMLQQAPVASERNVGAEAEDDFRDWELETGLLQWASWPLLR